MHAATSEAISSGRDEKGFYELIKLSVNPPGIADHPIHIRPERPMKELVFPGNDGRSGRVWANELSVLGELAELVEHLEEHTLWRKEDITWFVLTDQTPPLRPLQARRNLMYSLHYANREIVLRVAPWVPEKAVSKVYRDVQRQVLGHVNQRIREKNLKLFRFVVEHLEPVDLVFAKRMPKGSALVARWNKTYPKWSYRQDTKNFWRDYQSVRKAITDPVWRWERS